MKTTKCGECRHRGSDGGPGPVMVCEHPAAPDSGYIIAWEGGERVSYRCPLPTAQRSSDDESHNEEDTHA